MKRWIPLLCLGVLSGCSTLNENECRNANWTQIGIHDGQFGERTDLLARHREACSKYGLEADEAAYFAGREQGLVQYCDLNNSFRLGLNGTRYKGTCPNNIDLQFNRYNDAALQIYTLKTQLRDTDTRLDKEEREYRMGKDSLRERHERRSLIQQRQRLRDDLLIQQREVDRLMLEARNLSPTQTLTTTP